MATNNNAHTLDTSGQVAVDFAWGNFPLQPNDQRTETAASNIGGSTGDTGWSATTQVTGARLEFAGISKTLNNGITQTVPAGNHELDETGYGGYPSYTPAAGNYMVTAVSGDGTTVTYTAQNNLAKNDSVTITGLTASAYNLSAVTVASADTLKFTVTDSASAGLITGQRGKVQKTSALTGFDGTYVSGVAYIDVPSVVGLSTTLAIDALKDAGYVAADITTASAVTPAISNVALTSNVATITTAAAHGFAVGDLVTVAAVTATTVNATLVAIATVPTTTTFTYAKTTGNVASAVDTGTAKVPARFSTIKTQSVAAGAASIALGTTITVTPYAAS
jgi:hypothetical protein